MYILHDIHNGQTQSDQKKLASQDSWTFAGACLRTPVLVAPSSSTLSGANMAAPKCNPQVTGGRTVAQIMDMTTGYNLAHIKPINMYVNLDIIE